MLKPEYLEHVPDRMVELYSQAELDILQNMAERISKYDYFIPAAEWQAQKLNEMGMVYDDILKGLSTLTGRSKDELKDLMLEAGIKTLAVDDVRHKLAGHKVLPLQASPNLMQVINVNYQKTQKAFSNLAKTTARNGAKQFADALDQVHMQIISGAFDTEAAIRNALKSLSEKGVASVRYPSGRIDSIETSVRRATITGVNQSASKLQLARAEDVGCNLVETTAHAGARPEHAEWQGKVFMLKGSSEKYPNFYEATGYGTGAGLCGWNCRHNFYPYYEGISELAYTEDMLKSYESKSIEIGGKKYTEYEAQQILRYYERTRRKYKREFVMNKAAGLDTASASVKLRSYNEKIKHVEQITGLSHLGGNMTVVGYGRHEAKVATKESREFYNAFKRAYSLNAEGMPKTLASYYDMKYNNSPEYKVFKKYVLSIERGEISPLLGLSTYKEKVHQIDEQLIGLKTPQGIEIKDYSAHFVGRMIGHSAPNKKYNRTGVSVEDLKRCITQGEERTSGHEDTIMLIGSGCQVTYNPKTGVLVQTNRKDREI